MGRVVTIFEQTPSSGVERVHREATRPRLFCYTCNQAAIMSASTTKRGLSPEKEASLSDDLEVPKRFSRYYLKTTNIWMISKCICHEFLTGYPGVALVYLGRCSIEQSGAGTHCCHRWAGFEQPGKPMGNRHQDQYRQVCTTSTFCSVLRWSVADQRLCHFTNLCVSHRKCCRSALLSPRPI